MTPNWFETQLITLKLQNMKFLLSMRIIIGGSLAAGKVSQDCEKKVNKKAIAFVRSDR